jgi:hypothetical protein
LTASVDPNAHDRFILRQHIRPIVNQYEFSLPGADGQPGEPFCFVEQKRFKFKEDIRFYTDETKQEEQLRIKARQRFDPRARYDVAAADGAKIGEIQKVFGASLLRSTYALFDAQGAELATANEKSLAVALFRRLVGFVPYVGNFADWLPIPYHFDFKRGDTILGTHARRLQVPRHLHDRHERRPAAYARSPAGPGHRRRHGRAAGTLTELMRRPPWPAARRSAAGRA